MSRYVIIRHGDATKPGSTNKRNKNRILQTGDINHYVVDAEITVCLGTRTHIVNSKATNTSLMNAAVSH